MLLRHSWRGMLSLILVTLALAVVPAGCAQATPTPQPVTVRFACWENDEDYFGALADQFGKDQPIRVELVPKTQELLYRSTGDDADVLYGANVRERQAQGDIIALDALIVDDPAFDRPDYYPGTLEAYTIGGELWAIPAWLDVDVMYYNKDIFDAHGAAYPAIGWTRDDFMSAALAIRDPEGKAFSYIYGWPAWDPMLFMLSAGGQLWDAGQEPVRLTFDDPRNIEALDWFTRLASEYGVTLTPEETAKVLTGWSIPKYNGIWTGRVGLWTGGFSGRGGRFSGEGRKWPMEWGMTTVPRDVQAVTMEYTVPLAVSAQAQHPEACWQWLSFLSRQMPKDGISARRSLMESDRFEETVGSEAAAVARATLDGWAPFGMSYPDAYVDAVTVLDRAMQDILNGRVTPEEGLARAQREAEGQ